MSYSKHNFQVGQVLRASALNEMEEAIKVSRDNLFEGRVNLQKHSQHGRRSLTIKVTNLKPNTSYTIVLKKRSTHGSDSGFWHYIKDLDPWDHAWDADSLTGKRWGYIPADEYTGVMGETVYVNGIECVPICWEHVIGEWGCEWMPYDGKLPFEWNIITDATGTAEQVIDLSEWALPLTKPFEYQGYNTITDKNDPNLMHVGNLMGVPKNSRRSLEFGFDVFNNSSEKVAEGSQVLHLGVTNSKSNIARVSVREDAAGYFLSNLRVSIS